MGTSKGYIAPTSIHWSLSKRAVTQYMNGVSPDTRSNAASKFASAMKNDSAASSAFTRALWKMALFSNRVHTSGFESALREVGREDLIGKNAGEVFDELLNDFTNDGATKEDYLAAQAIGEALNILGIENLSELANIPTEDLIIEILSEYVKYSFAFRYSEKISAGRTPAQADSILRDMGNYISNKIHSDFDRSVLNGMDIKSLGTSGVANQLLVDALSIFEEYYGEV